MTQIQMPRLRMQKDFEARSTELQASRAGYPRICTLAFDFWFKLTLVHKKNLTDTLDSTGRHHLGAKMLLVISDRTVPSSDRLVFAHHNVFRNLVEQSVYVSIGSNLVEHEAYRKS